MIVKPTRRAVIDIGRRCPLRCKICYHLGKGDFSSIIPKGILKNQINEAKERGNKYIDFTGGEPTSHPDIVELVKYCTDCGLQSCIITCGLAGINLWNKLIDNGLKDVLLSVHGLDDIHDYIVSQKGAYKKIKKFIEYLDSKKMFWRVNSVITSKNYKQLPDMVKKFLVWSPKIVNFINFNPYYKWADQSAIDIECRYSESAPYLKEAILILEDLSDIIVNVRYYPFCLLKGYEKNICDMNQVMFDEFEWDYEIMPKTEERYKEHGKHLEESYCIESNRCKICTAYNICGGVNRSYHMRYADNELLPYFDQTIPVDPFHWRRNQRQMPEYD